MRRNILLSISLLVLLALVAGCKKNELDRSVEVLKPVPFDSVVKKYQKAEAGTLKFVAVNQTEILPGDFSDPGKAQIGIRNLEKRLGTDLSCEVTFEVVGNLLKLLDANGNEALVFSNPVYTAIPKRGLLLDCELKQQEFPVEFKIGKAANFSAKLKFDAQPEAKLLDPQLRKANTLISLDGEVQIVELKAKLTDLNFTVLGSTLTKDLDVIVNLKVGIQPKK